MDTTYREQQHAAVQNAKTQAGMLQTFARSMGHDLRTPLQALVFSLPMSEAAALAIKDAAIKGAAIKEKASELLEQIQQAGACTEMLSLIVSNLWELDAVEEGAMGDVLLPMQHREELDLSARLSTPEK